MGDLEFIELLGLIDINLSNHPEMRRALLERLPNVGFDLYSNQFGDNLKRITAASNYIPTLASQAIYVLWVIGRYAEAERIAKRCMSKHGSHDDFILRNYIFVLLTMGDHEKAKALASLSEVYKYWVGTIEKIQLGELAKVEIPGFGDIAEFYMTCFSTQSMEAALTHGSGKFCEQEELIALAKYARCKRVLEIGTLVGNHSVFFSRLCKCSFIKCVDINPKSCIATRLNLLLNGQDPTSFSIVNAKAGSPNDGFSTKAEKHDYFYLDSLASEFYDFIKIDIDGGELSFFESSYSYIAEHKPVIFSEIQMRNLDSILTRMKSLGYTYETLRSRGHGEVNILFIPSVQQTTSMF